MQNFNLEKIMAVIIGVVIGILIVSHIIGCGAQVSPEAISFKIDSTMAADSITHELYIDSINKEIDKWDSVSKMILKK